MGTPATWPKGQRPPVQRPKGSKNKKTLAREAAGVANWGQLKEWAETKGIEECVKKMKRLRGASYVAAYTKLLEYVKPKLARQEVVGDGGGPVLSPPDMSVLTKAELEQYILLSAKIAGK